jgi:hypothetical protein
LRKSLLAVRVVANKSWRFLLLRNFFGLSDNYQKSVYEQMFLLQYYGKWSFIELYNLPVGLRDWFMDRLGKELKEQAERNKR